MSEDAAKRPPFDYGSAEREVALVALQAAVLNRRIFLEAPEGEIGPVHLQVLVAIALTNPLEQRFDPGETARGLGRTLTLDLEHVWELIADLRHARMLRREEHPQDAPDDQVLWQLTAHGQAAAAEFIQRAARYLPGWPPPHR